MNKELDKKTTNKSIVSQDGESIHIASTQFSYDEVGKELDVLFSNPDKTSDIGGIKLVLQEHEDTKNKVMIILILTIGDPETNHSVPGREPYSRLDADVNVFGDIATKVDAIRNLMPDDTIWFDKLDALGDGSRLAERRFLAEAQTKSIEAYPTSSMFYIDYAKSAQEDFPKLMEILAGEHDDLKSDLISDNPKICAFMCQTIQQTMAELLKKSTAKLQAPAQKLQNNTEHASKHLLEKTLSQHRKIER